MKLHATAIEKILNAVENLGGHKDQTKLRKFFDGLDLTVYERKTGSQDSVLVETTDFVKKTTTVNQ